MSDAVSPLQGATFEGFATITEAGLRGMITLRGDLSSKKFQNAVTKVTGTSFPQARSIAIGDDQAIAWMSPDELLILTPHDTADDAVAQLSKSLQGTHHLAVNVSDARAMFTIAGARASEVLAKLSPADVASLPEGEVRRTRVAQVAAAFWRSGEDVFTLVTFRSTAGYVFNLLKNAALPGSEVGYL